MRRTFAALLFAALLVGAAGLAIAQGPPDGKGPQGEAGDGPGNSNKGPNGKAANANAQGKADKANHTRGKPAFVEESSKWVLRNDNISVWFHRTPSGKASPTLKVFSTGDDGNKSGYMVKIAALHEVDAGATSLAGAHQTVRLTKAAAWDVATNETNTTLTVTMTRAAGDATVGLVYHLQKDSAEVKFDLLVEDWPWMENASDHRLALEMVLVGQDVHATDTADSNVSFDGGYVAWEDTATATDASGNSTTLTVAPQTRGAYGYGNGGDGDENGRLVLVFQGAGGYQRLDYDPTLGVQSAETSSSTNATPGVAAVAGVGALAAAAVALRRRSLR